VSRRALVTSLVMVLVGAGLLGSGALGAQTTGALTSIKRLGAGGGTSFAIKSDGSLLGWGYNNHGQVGIGSSGSAVLKPEPVPGITNVVDAAGGDIQSLAVSSDGSLWSWGDNAYGELGIGRTGGDQPKPARVSGFPPVKQVDAEGTGEGKAWSLAVLRDGTVRAWGDNSNGQLGDGTTAKSPQPVTVSGLTGIVQVSAGLSHGLALSGPRSAHPGTVYAWGNNKYGQLGISPFGGQRLAPVAVSGLNGGVTAIAAGKGGDYSLALMQNGTVMAWGRNEQGMLGSGSLSYGRSTPGPVQGLTNVVAIGAGGGTGFAVKSDGTVWAWGNDDFGQLGNGKIAQGGFRKGVPTPQQVKGLQPVQQVVAGGGDVLALARAGQAYSWGINDFGNLGVNSTADKYATPGLIGATRAAPTPGGGTSNVLPWVLFAGAALVLLLQGVRRRPAAVGLSPAAFQAAPLPVYVPAEGATPADTVRLAEEQVAEAPDVEDGRRVHGRRIRLLRRVDLFEGVSDDVLEEVARVMKPLAVEGADVVVHEGDVDEKLFLVEAGTLATTAEIGGQPRELARVGPGEFFGEAALLGQERRSATVQAVTNAQLWTLAADDFRQLERRHPEIEQAVQRATSGRDRNESGVFDVEQRELTELEHDGRRIAIGRALDNQVVIASPSASRHHAVIEQTGDRFRLRDLDSQNGTYVNGAPIRRADLHDGDEIWVGDERIIFDRRAIRRTVEPQGIRLDALNLTTQLPDGKVLLHDISLSVLPGEFVAIVGGSGAGKTTLMDAMSGVRPATSGRVLYNGRDYYRNLSIFRNVLGYVPQDDIIHTDLPLRLTLEHASRLRLPADTSKEELDEAVDKALGELELTAQADTTVAQLSGGQRKRASIGVELLTEPRIFFLDEPTSGLDPLTDGQMMRLLRRLSDEGSTVVLTTHATKNVMLCDKVVFLAPGGQLAFVGTPHRALRYFEADAFDTIYQRLGEEATPEEWSLRFRSSDDYRRLIGEQLQPAPEDVGQTRSLGESRGSVGLARQFRQFAVLSRRRFDRFVHNPKTLPSLIMPPILFTVLALGIFHNGTFDATADSTGPLQILFLVAFSAFIFGLLFAVQEIVSEYAIFRRERMVNLEILPYVLSKLTFLAPLLIVMLIVMIAILWATGRLPTHGSQLGATGAHVQLAGVYGQLLLILALVGLVGLSLALLTSAFVSTSQQATDMLSVWIMPQVLFGGALVAVQQMGLFGKVLAAVAPVRWAFESLGHVFYLSAHFLTDTSRVGAGLAVSYGKTFDATIGSPLIILVAFIVVPLALTCVVLRRKTAKM
jgi:ABC-type multidrug transport system ATPase subunit/alpha-tubulin suppressor-like RCC1 family protein/CRP-like cAMP-binding protein